MRHLDFSPESADDREVRDLTSLPLRGVFDSNHYPSCSKASLQLGVQLTAAGCHVGNQPNDIRQLRILTAC